MSITPDLMLKVRVDKARLITFTHALICKRVVFYFDERVYFEMGVILRSFYQVDLFYKVNIFQNKN